MRNDPSGTERPWTFIDLFSGAGGMSCGFARHGGFIPIAAVDVEVGKPSCGVGRLECNRTYETNIGIIPFAEDMFKLTPSRLVSLIARKNPKGKQHLDKQGLQVLISCAPCTGFSRAKSKSHEVDDLKNTLVARSAEFVLALRPQVFLMENARELVKGNFRHHYEQLRERLESANYSVAAEIDFLTNYGLPQRRERALIVATRADLEPYTLRDLWRGHEVTEDATTVRRTIGDLPPLEEGGQDPDDRMHVCPKFRNEATRDRLRALPHDGGAWADLIDHPDSERLLTPGMKRYITLGKLGSHPDWYGRMWWDRPAATIKRESAHVGNGRYSHPEQDRMLSVREMALLQGFPGDYAFCSNGVSNMYRHIGDAVPPLISYQLAHVVEWILTGTRPSLSDVILPGTHVTPADVQPTHDLVQDPLFASMRS